jgi:hypothetical protein
VRKRRKRYPLEVHGEGRDFGGGGRRANRAEGAFLPEISGGGGGGGSRSR